MTSNPFAIRFTFNTPAGEVSTELPMKLVNDMAPELLKLLMKEVGLIVSKGEDNGMV